MTARTLASRWLLGAALGAVAPLVLAQMGPAEGGHEHGGWRDNPQAQQCRQQAQDKHLPRGPERRAFMEQCLKGKPGGSDPAKAPAANDPSGGHLHSERPASP